MSTSEVGDVLDALATFRSQVQTGELGEQMETQGLYHERLILRKYVDELVDTIEKNTAKLKVK